MKFFRKCGLALLLPILALTSFALQGADALFARNFRTTTTMSGGGRSRRKQACPTITKHKVGYVSRYNASKLAIHLAQRAIAEGDNTRHHTKTKGQFGEEAAERLFEKQGYYLSFSSFLAKVGTRCDCTLDPLLCPTQYNAKNNGLDNVFIPVKKTRSGRYVVDTRFRCILVESKYDGAGSLKLGTKGSICDEMTTPWIKSNLRSLTGKLSRIKQQAMSAGNDELAACAQKGIDQLKVVRCEFTTHRALRVATVLDGDGDMFVYLLRDSDQPPASDLSIERAGKELLSGLPPMTHAYYPFA